MHAYIHRVSIFLTYQCFVLQKELFGYSPLLLAVWQRHTEVVKVLLDEGAKCCQSPNCCKSPEICRENLLSVLAKDKETVWPAIPLINVKDRTALHIAAENGDEQMVELLINCKANLDAKDSVKAFPKSPLSPLLDHVFILDSGNLL